MTKEIVRFRRLPGNEDIPLPSRATPSASGYDVRSADRDFILESQSTKLISTGLMVELPAGMECQVRPRSGLAVKFGITIPNSPGTIDPDYRGELRVLLRNEGLEPVSLCRGDRIAQLVFHSFSTPEIVECQELESTERGQDGFGSTGIK
jgi:dUTP pyrophosphatase|tara:strand:+ start:641 stop:1090 length:450 start_codon:yes stop_codon:yes gene_type:complete